jgi:MFS family permease
VAGVGCRRRDGLVIGVLLGGVLTHVFGWEAVFLINVPLAGVVIALAFLLIPADLEREPGHSLDISGAVTVTCGSEAEAGCAAGPAIDGWGVLPAPRARNVYFRRPITDEGSRKSCPPVEADHTW